MPKITLTDSDREDFLEMLARSKDTLSLVQQIKGTLERLTVKIEKHFTMCEMTRGAVDRRFKALEDSDIVHRDLAQRVTALEHNMVDLSEFEDRIEEGRKFWSRKLVVMLLMVGTSVISSVLTAYLVSHLIKAVGGG